MTSTTTGRRVDERGCSDGSRPRAETTPFPRRPPQNAVWALGIAAHGTLDRSPESVVTRSWAVVVAEAGDHPRWCRGRDDVSDHRERLGCGERISGLGKRVRVGTPGPRQHAERHRQMRGDVGQSERPHQRRAGVEPGVHRRLEEQPEPAFLGDQATHPRQRPLRVGSHGRDDRRERKGEQGGGGIARRPRPTTLRRHAATVDDRAVRSLAPRQLPLVAISMPAGAASPSSLDRLLAHA